MVRGQIFANVYNTYEIVIISPQSGQVTGRISLVGLLEEFKAGTEVDVLNGIAYDPERDRLFVTGKRWPKLFEIRLKETE
jgi:glutaminyl-peptide cyclotransferase